METKSAKQSTRSNSFSNFHKKPGALLLSAAVVLVGVVLAIMFFLPKGERIDADGYQVVHMTSGQTFFGKLQNTSGDYLVLKTPYTAQDAKATETDTQAQTTLLKVSQQAYGPQDALSLKSDQVLFWQNLREDSKVTKAIESKQ